MQIYKKYSETLIFIKKKLETTMNNNTIGRVVRESIHKFLKEEFPEIEDVPTFDIINDNMSSSEIGDILESYLYDKNDRLVGRLCDLHFKYDTNKNRMLGTKSL